MFERIKQLIIIVFATSFVFVGCKKNESAKKEEHKEDMHTETIKLSQASICNRINSPFTFRYFQIFTVSSACYFEFTLCINRRSFCVVDFRFVFISPRVCWIYCSVRSCHVKWSCFGISHYSIAR